MIALPVENREGIPSQQISRLLREAGIAEVEAWTPVREGGNNRVYWGQSANQKLLLKLYFHRNSHQRDRLRGELCFYGLSDRAGVTAVPKALGWDLENRMGLFTFLDGCKLDAATVTADHVRQAANLVVRINNSLDEYPPPGDLPSAAESCFSFAAHLATVDKRLNRLANAAIRDDMDREAVAWIRNDLAPCWHHVRREAAVRAADAGRDLDAALPSSERWISPSDFGFHNALVDREGCLRFFDFEYAGWDDPAKLVADFFCQPSVPISLDWWEVLEKQLADCHRWTSENGQRARQLLPVYQIKWCCIMLNEFLPTEAQRRDFSNIGSGDRRAAQLRKARSALQQVGAAG